MIVADAGAHNYALTRRDARLLYVVCTRALHERAVLHTGALTPLLEGAALQVANGGRDQDDQS